MMLAHEMPKRFTGDELTDLINTIDRLNITPRQQHEQWDADHLEKMWLISTYVVPGFGEVFCEYNKRTTTSKWWQW